jgi:predicted dehydrogenase
LADWRSVVRRQDVVDVVVVCTTLPVHADVSVAAMRVALGAHKAEKTGCIMKI